MKLLAIAKNAVTGGELLAVIEDTDGSVSTANVYVLKSSHDTSDALSALQQSQADVASGKKSLSDFEFWGALYPDAFRALFDEGGPSLARFELK